MNTQDFIHNIINGIYSGFPPCCVLNFAILKILGHAPGSYMNSKYGEDGFMYVRCDKCRQNDISIDKIREGGVARKAGYLLITDNYYASKWIERLKELYGQ